MKGNRVNLGRRKTKEILGSPFVPPPAMTKGLQRVRALLGGAHRRSAPPAMFLLEALLTLFDNRVLGLLVELDVPDLLDRPRTAEELAALTSTDVDRLGRVLRYATGRGFVSGARGHRFRANGLTRLLRRDHPQSWRGWVEFAGSEWLWQAVRHLEEALRDPAVSGLEAATGHSFFDFVHHERPAAGRSFDRAMQAGAAVQALALAHALAWTGVTSVCDVGGGNGAALQVLLLAHPNLEATLFDLPAVLSDVDLDPWPNGVGRRCRVVSGDFFVTVPAGCDRYLLLAIIHDWSDEDAVRILSNVAAALPPGGRAVVVESPLPDKPRDQFVAMSDLLMMTLVSGRERTADELARLFAAAGLTLAARHPLATGFVAFELRAD